MKKQIIIYGSSPAARSRIAQDLFGDLMHLESLELYLFEQRPESHRFPNADFIGIEKKELT